MMAKKKAVFLDRDGTINEEAGYLDSLEKLKLFPETSAAIRLINESGMKAVVITNQSGVARGYFDEGLVNTVHYHIQELLKRTKTYIDAFYYCPHHETAGRGIYLKSCTCRKPKTGMLLRAAEELDIDLAGSYMIGDTVKDIETAKNIPMKGILVETGHYNIKKDGKIDSLPIKPDYLAANILDAVNWIMKDRWK
jgi:D-glycero-D-manno-heptose 1,7-bisphosphate phosphatase